MILDIDQDLREHVRYKDPLFPVEVWTGNYSMFPEGLMSSHWHNEIEFGVLISGKVDCYFNELHFTLKEGDCIFINSGILHYSRQKENFENSTMFTISFPHTLICGNINDTVYNKYYKPILESFVQAFIIDKNTESGRTIYNTLLKIYRLDDSELGYELDCIQLLNKIWKNVYIYIKEKDLSSYCYRSSSSLKNEIRSKLIISYIHDNFSKNIKIDDIARFVSISRSECFRSFKQFTEKTPINYINDYRLSQASKLLLETDYSVTDISNSCGFNSSSYFGKLFKEKYGLTPYKFRYKESSFNTT